MNLAECRYDHCIWALRKPVPGRTITLQGKATDLG